MANGRIRCEKSTAIASTWLKLTHENGARAFSHSLDPKPPDSRPKSGNSGKVKRTVERLNCLPTFCVGPQKIKRARMGEESPSSTTKPSGATRVPSRREIHPLEQGTEPRIRAQSVTKRSDLDVRDPGYMFPMRRLEKTKRLVHIS